MKPEVLDMGTCHNFEKTWETVTVREGKFIRVYNVDDELPLRIKRAIQRYKNNN